MLVNDAAVRLIKPQFFYSVCVKLHFTHFTNLSCIFTPSYIIHHTLLAKYTIFIFLIRKIELERRSLSFNHFLFRDPITADFFGFPHTRTLQNFNIIRNLIIPDVLFILLGFSSQNFILRKNPILLWALHKISRLEPYLKSIEILPASNATPDDVSGK